MNKPRTFLHTRNYSSGFLTETAVAETMCAIEEIDPALVDMCRGFVTDFFNHVTIRDTPSVRIRAEWNPLKPQPNYTAEIFMSSWYAAGVSALTNVRCTDRHIDIEHSRAIDREREKP